ncbi:hypothetical protein Tco_1363627 [Tanacetum coccineum]
MTSTFFSHADYENNKVGGDTFGGSGWLAPLPAYTFIGQLNSLGVEPIVITSKRQLDPFTYEYEWVELDYDQRLENVLVSPRDASEGAGTSGMGSQGNNAHRRMLLQGTDN